MLRSLPAIGPLLLVLAGTHLTAVDGDGIDPASFSEGAYTLATPDGNLQQGGKRVRFWGMIGYLTHFGMLQSIAHAQDPAARRTSVAKAYRAHDFMARRLVDLGFNLHRLWDAVSGPEPLRHDYEPGDGSLSDLVAHELYALDQRGIGI